MSAEPRRIWTGVVLPAELHTALTERVGPRGLTAAMASAMDALVRRGGPPSGARPARDGGVVEITLRIPVSVADAADRWKDDNGFTRQAIVEYAALAALEEAG